MAIIIAVDGNDCTGKNTHCNLLKERFEKVGVKVAMLSFPQYDNESSVFVKKYLAGDYGKSAFDVNPYTSSMFFIMDRLVSYLNEWKKVVEESDLVIVDRYVSSNLLHQGSKILSNTELMDYIKWECDLEFTKLGLPRPDVTYFLKMPLWASKLIRNDRPNKITGGSQQDIHESDDTYMMQVQKRSEVICKYMKWVPISCISPAVGKGVGDRADILSINTINDMIYKDILARYGDVLCGDINKFITNID